MYFSSIITAALAFVISAVSAYRPVQFVKHTGESGRADQAFSLVNYFNTTTQQSDLYIRMWMFRYGSANKGWTALGLGPQMKGALMFIIYGDPVGNDLTLSMRTVDGHHPPRPLDEMKSLYDGEVPEVEVQRTGFEAYTGEYYSEKLKAKPSHLGIAEFVVYGYERFTAPALGLHADSTNQAMIWSSNFEQDFGGDYGAERGIEMHKFGLGFGFLWVDYLNARSDVPFFQPINEISGHSGLSEISEPAAPTEQELTKGAAIVAAQSGGGDSIDAVPEKPEDKDVSPASEPDTSTPGADDGSNIEAPVKTVKQWNIRSWMWYVSSCNALLDPTNISDQAHAWLPNDSRFPARLPTGNLSASLSAYHRRWHILQPPLDAQLPLQRGRLHRRANRLHELPLDLHPASVHRHPAHLRTRHPNSPRLAPPRRLRGQQWSQDLDERRARLAWARDPPVWHAECHVWALVAPVRLADPLSVHCARSR